MKFLNACLIVLGIAVMAIATLGVTVKAAPKFQATGATPTPIMPYANTVANLYAGPGVEFAVVGNVAVGQVVPIVQVSTDGQWYRSSNGAIGPWIAAAVLSNPPRPENLWPLTPIAQSAPYLSPTPTPTVTFTPLPLPTDLPTVTPVMATPVPLALPTEVPTAVPAPTSAPPTAIPVSGVTYSQICDIDEGNMTDPQLAAHAAQFVGQTFSGWQGWVYDVVDSGDGQYDLSIAMEERGFFWTRDIVIESIPTDLAQRLNVEQPLLFDGRIVRVDYPFETMCNPLVVDEFVLR